MQVLYFKIHVLRIKFQLASTVLQVSNTMLEASSPTLQKSTCKHIASSFKVQSRNKLIGQQNVQSATPSSDTVSTKWRQEKHRRYPEEELMRFHAHINNRLTHGIVQAEAHSAPARNKYARTFDSLNRGWDRWQYKFGHIRRQSRTYKYPLEHAISLKPGSTITSKTSLCTDL